MRTGAPEQTTNWLPGASGRLQPRTDRHEKGDRILAGDGNTA
jgi:hypothetical protein